MVGEGGSQLSVLIKGIGVACGLFSGQQSRAAAVVEASRTEIVSATHHRFVPFIPRGCGLDSRPGKNWQSLILQKIPIPMVDFRYILAL